MANPEYLFIHPWLHPDEHWAGFQVTCSGSGEACAAALARFSAQPVVQAMRRDLLWFVPVASPECLAAALAFPSERSVMVLMAPEPTAGEPDDWKELDAKARQSGRQLGLLLGPRAALPATGTWNYVILDTNRARSLPPYTTIGLAAKSTVALSGLNNRNDLGWATAHQCGLVSGEYLLKRSTLNNRPDMTRMRLLKLLALITQDADNREMEEVFRQEPKLAYGLLRLVNSVALAPRSPITSFGQAITILGRQQLQRWLQLLVYADPNNDQQPNPLLLLAATRGRLMELLAPHIRPSPEPELLPDTAFMTGTFSLLDVLLNLPMSEILVQLPLAESIHAALENQSGPLGQLLQALIAADNRDFATASRLLAGLCIDGDTFMVAQACALQWAAGICATAG